MRVQHGFTGVFVRAAFGRVICFFADGVFIFRALLYKKRKMAALVGGVPLFDGGNFCASGSL